jgi:hypothetical protein
MTNQLTLPSAEDAGDIRRWYLPVNDANPRAAELEYYRTYARFLGLGTSHTDEHADVEHTEQGGRFVSRGVRCNACRWFEVRVLRELELPDGVVDVADVADPRDVRLGNYVVHTTGGTITTGEVPLYKYELTPSPHMVIELLTTRRTTDRGPEVFLAKPAARALAASVGFDRALEEAYVNRAVS